jgi:hypothetical protein
MNEMKKKSKKPLECKNCLTCESSFVPKRNDSHYCSRLCYRRNPEIAKKYSERTNAYQKLHSREPERRFKKLGYKCRHEQIDMSLDLDAYTVLIARNCEYCNKSLSGETGCGLDRINSAGGYSTDNVVPCCGACNQVKNIHLTFNEMKIAMKAVLEHRKALGNE